MKTKRFGNVEHTSQFYVDIKEGLVKTNENSVRARKICSISTEYRVLNGIRRCFILE